MVVVVRLSMRLLMGLCVGGGITRRVTALLVAVEIRSSMVVLVVVCWRALLKGMHVLKRCQTRWFVMLTV